MSQPPQDRPERREPEQPDYPYGQGQGPAYGHQPYEQQAYGQQYGPHDANQQGYGAYGEPTYGPYGPSHAGGAPGYVTASPEQSSTRTQAIVSLVVNAVSIFVCANVFGIVGGILSAVALGKVDHELPQARSLVRWSWIVFGVGLALTLIGWVLFFSFFAFLPFFAMSSGY